VSRMNKVFEDSVNLLNSVTKLVLRTKSSNVFFIKLSATIFISNFHIFVIKQLSEKYDQITEEFNVQQ